MPVDDRSSRTPARSPSTSGDTPPTIEAWLYPIIIATLIMVVGFFVPRSALRPTAAVAAAFMALGLLMLIYRSWRHPGEF